MSTQLSNLQAYRAIRITDHTQTHTWRLKHLREVYRALSAASQYELETAVLAKERRGQGALVCISPELMETLKQASLAIMAQEAAARAEQAPNG